MGEKTKKEALRAWGKAERRRRKDGIDKGRMSYVFMFTGCPFDVHTKTTWGPQQPVPVANMTVSLAASPHAGDFTPPLFPPCPAVLTAIPSLSSWRPPLPTSQPSISHANAHLAPPNQASHFCQAVSLYCQWFWKQPCTMKIAHHMQQETLPTNTKLSK